MSAKSLKGLKGFQEAAVDSGVALFTAAKKLLDAAGGDEASRDGDFGLQLVGRILRVRRRLHARAQSNKLPEYLKSGHVFLADAETQTGLDIAGQKINQIQTQDAKASGATVVLRFNDGKPDVAIKEASGQPPLFRLENDVEIRAAFH